MPKVSVVVPTYNHLQYLPQAIGSILTQTYADFELIIVNDGSTDGTFEYLNSLSDPRLRIFHQENGGVNRATNAGIIASRGEYITFMSADDYAGRYFLESHTAALEANPDAAMAYSPYYNVDEKGNVLSLEYDNVLLLRDILTGTFPGFAGHLMRRVVYDRVGLHQEITEEVGILARLLAEFETVYVVEPSYFYRNHPKQRSTDPDQQIAQRFTRQAIPTLFREFMERHGWQFDPTSRGRLYGATA
ncbi:MAG: glycosyltransferase family 2 protein, partial [Alphaproteobacteria bacterium]